MLWPHRQFLTCGCRVTLADARGAAPPPPTAGGAGPVRHDRPAQPYVVEGCFVAYWSAVTVSDCAIWRR